MMCFLFGRHTRMSKITYHNSILVALPYLLAQWHGLPAKAFPIALAGLLHNIGTLKVDPVC